MTEYELTAKYDSRKQFYGKAIVKEDAENGVATLYSYKKRVAEIRTTCMDDFDCTIFMVDKWDSATTIRHIKEFLRQAGLEIKTKDDIYEQCNMVNV